MSEATVALLGVILTLLLSLMGFIWRAASTTTEHRLRIETIERNHAALTSVIKTLETAVTKLDKHLAVSRASQGQYSQSDQPPKG